MDIETSSAIKFFFPNPSLVQVLYEALANSLDAGATEVTIRIEIDGFNAAETLSFTITDMNHVPKEMRQSHFLRHRAREVTDISLSAHYARVTVRAPQLTTGCMVKTYDPGSKLLSARITSPGDGTSKPAAHSTFLMCRSCATRPTSTDRVVESSHSARQ